MTNFGCSRQKAEQCSCALIPFTRIISFRRLSIQYGAFPRYEHRHRPLSSAADSSGACGRASSRICVASSAIPQPRHLLEDADQWQCLHRWSSLCFAVAVAAATSTTAEPPSTSAAFRCTLPCPRWLICSRSVALPAGAAWSGPRRSLSTHYVLLHCSRASPGDLRRRRRDVRPRRHGHAR